MGRNFKTIKQAEDYSYYRCIAILQEEILINRKFRNNWNRVFSEEEIKKEKKGSSSH